eukprot:4620114-Pyramimonas_sp.AAC.1
MQLETAKSEVLKEALREQEVLKKQLAEAQVGVTGTVTRSGGGSPLPLKSERREHIPAARTNRARGGSIYPRREPIE